MMKSVLIFVFSLFNVAFANFPDCQQREAQFIGFVKETQVIRVEQQKYECSYKIEFTKFNPSILCPIDQAELTTVEFKDEDCSKEAGLDISGVVVSKDGFFFIE